MTHAGYIWNIVFILFSRVILSWSQKQKILINNYVLHMKLK